MVKDLNKTIGLLGGSFDPAHKGHLEISKIAIKKLKLNNVFWIVAKKNPFKNNPYFSISQRLKKAKELAKSVKKIKVIYLDKKVSSSKSINIIDYLINKKKIQNIYFIIGSDNLINFHKWKNWKKIVKLTKLVVFSRRGYDRKGDKSPVVRYYKKKITFIKNKHIIISSTDLRKARLNY
tara:strand:- start:900 stop:1436 length:537 start_codon:yes stop_codon:yes gene_type:complete